MSTLLYKILYNKVKFLKMYEQKRNFYVVTIIKRGLIYQSITRFVTKTSFNDVVPELV